LPIALDLIINKGHLNADQHSPIMLRPDQAYQGMSA
jgi:hypothetical protein